MRVCLLDHRPTDEDAFGVHGPIADALVDTILKEDGGRAIALDGGWGSGKTSVIRMMRKRLFDRCGEDAIVFSFDAWSHSGDHLRHVFLKQLLACLDKTLMQCCPDQVELIRESVDQLCIAESRYTSKERRNRRGGHRRLIVAITLGLLPAFLVLATAPWSADQPILYWAGFFGMLLPALSYLFFLSLHIVARKIERQGYTFFRRFWWKKDLVRFIRDHRTHPRDALLGVWPHDTPQESATSIHVKDRNSQDFLDVFNSLTRGLLESSPSTRLVIVMDNLDRLPPEMALDVWGTMRLFVDSFEPLDWATRLWLVVPFDKVSLEALWDDGTSLLPVGTANDSDTVRRSRPLSFMDKSFFAHFDVPPLMLADWDERARNWLWDVLPEWPNNEREGTAHQVVEILSDHVRSVTKRPPSPRELKLILNDIGTLVRQHGRQFELSVLATYVVLRRSGLSVDDIRLRLQTGKAPNSNQLGVIGSNGPGALACLVFGTHNEQKALELLLRDPLILALAEGDNEKLLTLVQTPAFAPAAHDLLDGARRYMDGDLAKLDNAAKAISAAGLMESELDTRVHTSLRDFARSAIGDLKVQQPSDELGECLATLLGVARDSQATQIAWRDRTRIALSREEEESEDSPGVQLRACFEHLLKATVALGHENSVPETIVVTCSPGVGARFFAELSSLENSDFKRRLTWEGDRGQMLQAITPEHGDAAWMQYKYPASQVLMETRSPLAWSEFAKRCEQIVGTVESIPADELWTLLDSLRSLTAGPCASAQENLSRLSSQGHLHHHFNQFAKVEDWRNAARLLLSISNCGSLGEKPNESRESSQGFDVIENLLNAPADRPELVEAVCSSELGALSSFVSQLLESTAPSRRLIRAILDRKKQATQLCGIVTADMAFDHWADLEAALATDKAGLEMLNLIVKEHTSSSELTTRVTNSQFDLTRITLYQAVLEQGADLTEAVLAFVAEGLKGISKDEWLSSILKADPLVRLLEVVRERHSTFEAGINLLDALLEVAEQAISEGLGDEFTWTDMQSLVDATGAQGSVQIGREIRNKLYSKRGEGIGEDLWRLFSRELTEIISRHPNEDDIAYIFKPALSAKSECGARFVRDALMRSTGVFGIAPNDVQENFKDRLIQLANGEEDDKRTTLAREICEQLEIRYKELTPESDEQAEPAEPKVHIVSRKKKTKERRD